MTITFTPLGGEPADMQAETAKLFDWSAGALIRAINDINDGKFDEARVTAAMLKDLRGAYHVAMEERAKLGKDIKNVCDRGAAGSGALELDAARDEIGRRLACLRGARGG